MQKIKSIIFSLALAAIAGFSSISWAAERPNTPECAYAKGSFDTDLCHIQYIEPLQKEVKELWSKLLEIRGQKAEDNPWVFRTYNQVCDQSDQRYYDEKKCLLHMPGKLAQEKYLIREELKGIVTRQAAAKRLPAKSTASKNKLSVQEEKNKKLAEELAKIQTGLKPEKTRGLTEEIGKLKKEIEFKSRIIAILYIISAALAIITILLAMYLAIYRKKNLTTQTPKLTIAKK